MIPHWLHFVSIAALVLGLMSSAIIAADVAQRPQKMWIMNLVWPIIALFASLLALGAYFVYERAPKRGEKPAHQDHSTVPFPAAVGKATLHCGSGCVLGDICAEWLVFAYPAVLVLFGWKSLFDEKVFAGWIVDFLFAFAFGIAFQYFTIVPMRHLSFKDGLLAAVKADALSLTAWQIGMYGFMAFAHFYLFRHVLGTALVTNSAVFWFMMQIAMVFGFMTSYPINWWLVTAGIKEKM